MRTVTFKLLPAIIILFIVAGCRKSGNETIQLQGQYVSANTIELTAPVMYTAAGRSDDANVMRGYLDRRFWGGDFIFDSATSSAGNTMSIEFNSTTADIAANDTALVKKYDIVDKNASGFVLEGEPISFLKGDLSDAAKLAEHADKIKRYGDCTPVPIVSGFSERCIYSQKFPFITEKNKFYLSFLRYAISINRAGRMSGVTYSGPGLLNNEIIGKLIAGDTVIIQTGRLLFNKQ